MLAAFAKYLLARSTVAAALMQSPTVPLSIQTSASVNLTVE